MGSFLVGFILGALAGWAAALRLRPKKEEEGGDWPQERGEEFQARSEEIIERIRENTRTLVDEAKVALQQAIEEGKAAAARKSAELEGLVRKVRREEGGKGTKT